MPNDSNRYLKRSRKYREKVWNEIGDVGSLSPSVDERWPILRLVIELKMPLSEVEKWDLEDIRQLNAILDMRQDCDGAVDAYQAAQASMERKRQ